MNSDRSYRSTIVLAAIVGAVLVAAFVFGDPTANPPRPPSAAPVTPAVEASQPAAPAAPVLDADPFAGVDIQLARVSEIAGAERLESPAATRRGDRLRIGISSDRDLHVYAFNQELGGQPTVMFPLAVLDTRNPLPPGEHELPGTAQGAQQSYTVDSRAASEEVLVVVSEQPIAALQARVATLIAVGNDPGHAGSPVDLDAIAAEAGPAAAIQRWVLLHEDPASRSQPGSS